MRQKFCVTLAVAVLALSGAREACKQFNGLRSLAGEWSSVWNTMLVYANTYAEGAESRPAVKTLLASSAGRGESAAAAVARVRRARARAGRTPRSRRDGSAELRIDLEELASGFAGQPGAKPAATGHGSKPRHRVAADAEETANALAGAFHSDFDAESLRALAAGEKIEIPRLMSDELSKLWRAEVERKLVRGERAGAKGRSNRDRFVVRMVELPRASAETLRAAEPAVETWPAGAVVEGHEGFEENEVFFTAPQSGSGLLNCDAQPRR